MTTGSADFDQETLMTDSTTQTAAETSAETEAATDTATEGATEGATDAATADATAAAPEPGSLTRRLEEEGEIAADYLEELLDIADLDGDIDIDVDHARAAVAIVAEGSSGRALKRLVGEEGEVLDALQELTRLAVQARTGERSRLMLDIAGFRAARRVELAEVARTVIEKVKETGSPVALEAMNPFERKVVHDVVAAAGLVSDSEGEEPSRHVVVHPAV